MPWNLTRLAFPGVKTRSPPDSLRYLDRTSGEGRIEYVTLIVPNSTTILFVSQGRLRTLDCKGVEQWSALGHENGVSVVLRNYPGYGNTPGPVTTTTLGADAIQLVQSVMAEKWAQGQELVLLGNSIGCGPTVWLATQGLGVRRVVLVSPYTSICALAPFWIVLTLSRALKVGSMGGVSRAWLWLACPSRLGWLQGSSWDPFPSIKMVKNLCGRIDVFVLHGEKDTTIPLAHSKALVDEIINSDNDVTARLCVVPETDHRDTRLRGDLAIWKFVKGCGEDELSAAIKTLERDRMVEVRNHVGMD